MINYDFGLKTRARTLQLRDTFCQKCREDSGYGIITVREVPVHVDAHARWLLRRGRR